MTSADPSADSREASPVAEPLGGASADARPRGEEPSAGKGRLGAIFVTVFLDLLGFGLVMPLLPRYAKMLHATPLMVGLLGASYSLMQFLFVPLWGRLSDRIGRRPVLLGSLLATGGSMLMLGFAQSLVWLFVARIAGGIATANIATAQAYIADSTTPSERARGMGLIGMAFGLGFILGPTFGGILSRRSLGTPALVAAGLAFANLLWAIRSLPESLPKEHRSKQPRRKGFGVDLDALRTTIALPELGVVVALFFLATFSFANLEQTFALYAMDGFAMSTEQTGYVLGAVGLTSALVQGGFIGPLEKRYGAVKLLRAGIALQSVGMAIIAWSAGHHPAFLYIGCIVLSSGNGVATPCFSTIVSRRAPANMQGGALGTQQSMGALARVFGPTWGGLSYGWGMRLPFVTAAVGLGAGVLLALRVRDRR